MKKGIWSVCAVLLLIVLLAVTALFGVDFGAFEIAPVSEGVTLGLDLVGGSEITYEAVVPEDMDADTLARSMEAVQAMLRERLNSLGYTESGVYLRGNRGVVVEIPNVDSPEQAVQMLGSTAVVEFRSYDGEILISGEHIESAVAAYLPMGDGGTYEYCVSLKLSPEGREKFRVGTMEAAQRSREEERIIAIVMDGQVISAPGVSAEYASTGIDSDTPVIELGSGDAEYAKYLASLISSGALPFRLRDTRLQTVGASLGERSLETALLAGAIGVLLVMVYMAVVYRRLGLVADLSLLLYMALFGVVMSILRINLSLPGIAGIILTVGMAVDANVVIYERIREELLAGKTLRSAVDAGFHRALGAILDSNITTMIAGFVLLWQGTGPILGFAKTLLIGVVLSMLCMLLVPRRLLRSMAAARHYRPFHYGLPKGFQPGEREKYQPRVLPFVSKRRLFTLISGLLCLTALVSLILLPFGVNLFNLDIDFVGGVTLEYELDRPVTAEISAEVADMAAERTGVRPGSVVKTGNDGHSVLIKTRELTSEQRDAIGAGLAELYGAEHARLSSADFVSATVGKDITRSAFLASLLAAALILIYISLRFELRSGLASVICLLHDVLVMLSFYVILRVSLNMNFIAAALTIIGYSINATIVIFDRIRENRKKAGGEYFGALVDLSVSQTLRRSIGTTVTTMIPVVLLLILGVDSIRNFALPILIGVLAGGYSSTCVAGPLWDLLRGKHKTMEQK